MNHRIDPIERCVGAICARRTGTAIGRASLATALFGLAASAGAATITPVNGNNVSIELFTEHRLTDKVPTHQHRTCGDFTVPAGKKLQVRAVACHLGTNGQSNAFAFNDKVKVRLRLIAYTTLAQRIRGITPYGSHTLMDSFGSLPSVTNSTSYYLTPFVFERGNIQLRTAIYNADQMFSGNADALSGYFVYSCNIQGTLNNM